MIGTGNIRRGIISESAGTVLSLATFVDKPISELRLPTYCGPFPDTYVILPVCESGGICLEWYKNEFLADNNFHMIDETILTEKKKKVPIFLPYIAGTNAPYFNEWEKGVFFGFTAITSKFDFALSIMQGVACLLQMNIEYLESCGIEVDKLISTGGGAKSRLWTQIKSDITGREILVPKNEEAPSLGAALLSSIHCGYFESLETALPNTISVSKVYTPSNIKDSQQIYKNFRNVYSSLIEAFKEF
jgi:sugar (pentulose or hexulose) kinase